MLTGVQAAGTVSIWHKVILDCQAPTLCVRSNITLYQSYS